MHRFLLPSIYRFIKVVLNQIVVHTAANLVDAGRLVAELYRHWRASIFNPSSGVSSGLANETQPLGLIFISALPRALDR